MDRTAVDTDKKTLNGLTAEMVKSKMEQSHRRLKELYALRIGELEKLEEKIGKLTEKRLNMKEELETLEEELTGLQESYYSYCKETGLKAILEHS
jgi:molecular chaperone GrpE (heat shock protein)